LGYIFFGISAVAGYLVPSTGSILDQAAANRNTSLGAACFVACALDTLLSGEAAKMPGFRRLHELEHALERCPASDVTQEDEAPQGRRRRPVGFGDRSGLWFDVVPTPPAAGRPLGRRGMPTSVRLRARIVACGAVERRHLNPLGIEPNDAPTDHDRANPSARRSICGAERAHCDGAAAASALEGVAESVEWRLRDDSGRGCAFTLQPAEGFVWPACLREARPVERYRFALGAVGPEQRPPRIRRR
jgi:hypothetical protein